MRSDGRPAISSARGYAEGPTVLKAATSSPAVPARPSPSRSRTEDEVGAERLWWSEYCEQKLQELQGSFSKEIKQVREGLQADLRFSEDRLAELVESEKAQRNRQLSDLRREVEHQSAEMSEMVRSQVDLKEQMASFKGPELRSVVETAQSEDSRSPIAPSVVSESSKLQHLDAALADLRRELQTCQEQSFNQSSEVEQLVNSLKRDLAEVQEKVSLHSKASDEQRSLQQVFSQSAGDLGRGIEGLSSSMMAMEQDLRQALQRTDQQLRAELEEVQHTQKQTSQSLKDEREARGRDSGIVRSLLEASGNRLDQIERDLGQVDVHKIMTSLEEMTNDLAQLQLAQCQLQAEHRSSRSQPAAEGDSSSPVAMEGHFLLRFEAMEAKVEAQVPKSLNLEAQIKALSNEANKRFHDLESQIRKNHFDAASVFARLDSVEQDTLKLVRDQNESSTLRGDVEAVKRRLVAISGDRPPAPSAAAAEAVARRRALLPPELRENISNLVQKVGETVNHPLPGDEVTSEKASYHSRSAKSGSDLAEQLQQQLRDGTVSQEDYRQALQVMQQLKERNESLRAKNAELAEEMLVQPDAHAAMHLPSFAPEQMIPAEIRGGSAMVPVSHPVAGQFPRHTTGAIRTASPTRANATAKAPAVAVPVMQIGPGTPVMVQRVPQGVPRTASPGRRQYF